jgi:hypothetical protein
MFRTPTTCSTPADAVVDGLSLEPDGLMGRKAPPRRDGSSSRQAIARSPHRRPPAQAGGFVPDTGVRIHLLLCRTGSFDGQLRPAPYRRTGRVGRPDVPHVPRLPVEQCARGVGRR